MEENDFFFRICILKYLEVMRYDVYNLFLKILLLKNVCVEREGGREVGGGRGRESF